MRRNYRCIAYAMILLAPSSCRVGSPQNQQGPKHRTGASASGERGGAPERLQMPPVNLKLMAPESSEIRTPQGLHLYGLTAAAMQFHDNVIGVACPISAQNPTLHPPAGSSQKNGNEYASDAAPASSRLIPYIPTC